MKTNLYDNILEGLTEMIEEVSDSISKEFKGVNPFDKEPVSKKQALFDFSQLGPEVQQALRDNLGEDTIDDYLNKLQGGM